jgi:hypothetical protein
MRHPSCPGYARAPYADLVADYPGEDVYPPAAFRTEWGPIFHRGRLDGSARILVLGQDPAAHEAVTRRVLIGEAGQRIQGFLARLGIETSYVILNTFLYSVYGQRGGEAHVGDPEITAYRNRWLDAAAEDNELAAVLTLGHLADTAYHAWPGADRHPHTYVNVVHPTYPESASASGSTTLAAAMKRLCASWNAGLDRLADLTPDSARPLVHYGDALTPADDAPVPEADLPAGLPAWMRGLDAWASRTGATAAEKRATLTVRVPAGARPPSPERLAGVVTP